MAGSQTERVTKLLDNLTAHRTTLTDTHGDLQESARADMIANAQSLIAALETPMEWTIRTMWQEASRNAAVRLAIDLGIFKSLSKATSTGKTSNELAAQANANPQLTSRLLKHLASTCIIKEVAADTYTSNALSSALAEPKYEGGVIFCFDAAHPSFVTLPGFYKSNGYQPFRDSNGTQGPFQHAHKTPISLFSWLQEDPHRLQAFQLHMSGYNEGRPQWYGPGFYPVTERLSAVPPSSPLLVDIGGGLGHDLAAFHKTHPTLPGRLILQDLPAVVAQSPHKATSLALELTPHDFFTPQPVKGARAYYLHSVLHDWTDEKCRQILRHLTQVMRPNYSKVLINEYVLPATGAPSQITSLDWILMCLGSSRERTEAEWRTLVESVGLKVVGVWTKEKTTASLIEAVLEGDDVDDDVGGDQGKGRSAL